MIITFEQHWDMLVLTPSVAFQRGECDDSCCDERHWRINCSFLFWSVEFFFTV